MAATLLRRQSPGCLSLFSNSLLATTWALSPPQSLPDHSNSSAAEGGRESLKKKEGGRIRRREGGSPSGVQENKGASLGLLF